MYNKLFTKILDSSVWLEAPHTRLVWITMLAMHDAAGFVALSCVENVALRARVSLEEAKDAIKSLEGPDKHNPNQELNGRRLVRVEGEGWIVINAEKYRAIVTSEETRRMTRERVARFRAKMNVEKESDGGSRPCNAPVTQAEAEAEKQLHPETATPLSKGEGFGLSKQTNTTDFDLRMALILKRAIQTLPPRITGIQTSKPSTWSAHIKKLRLINKLPEDSIEKVMVWYSKNIGKEFVPQAFSGEAFRKKFPQLEQAANKDLQTVVEISPQAKELASTLLMKGWPKGSGKDIPGAVQASITEYKKWLKQRHEFHKLLVSGGGGCEEKERRYLIMLGDHLKLAMPSSSAFVQEWFDDVYQQVKGWDRWSGNLKQFVFKPNSERFIKQGRDISKDYGKRWDRYTELMAKIKEVQDA